jgi:hypothetical protein
VSDRRLTVLLDEGTPVPVARPFTLNGHRVIHFHEVLTRGEGVKDTVVAAMAIQNDAALIAVDPDLGRLMRRFGSAADNARFKSLSGFARPEAIGRGRDGHCWPPPAQIPAGAANAPGSHLG